MTKTLTEERMDELEQATKSASKSPYYTWYTIGVEAAPTPDVVLDLIAAYRHAEKLAEALEALLELDDVPDFVKLEREIASARAALAAYRKGEGE
jgi:hypothetical protein